MMSMVSDKTELEVFFSPRLAGNTPQFATSATFFELIVALANLVEGLAISSSATEDPISGPAREALKKAILVESKLRVEQSRQNVMLLIDLLSEVVGVSKRGVAADSPTASDLLARAKKLFVSVLLVARDSDDASLKNGVLSLAKRWETAD
jgi:hypothetical protein